MSEGGEDIDLLNVGDVAMITDFSAAEASLITNLGLVSGMMLRLRTVPGEHFDAYMATGQDRSLSVEQLLLLPASAVLDVITQVQAAYRDAIGRAAR